MIWAVAVGVVAYFVIASAGYESARQDLIQYDEGYARILHVIGVVLSIVTLYLSSNTN